MTARLNPYEVAPDVFKHATGVQQAIEASGLDKTIIELIKLRASQLNGCAYCLNMHAHDALKHGETQARIFVLAGWKESTLYSPRERAALAFTDAMTHVASRGTAEPEVSELKKHFDEKEVVAIVNQVAMINFWNRIAVSFGTVHPFESKPESRRATAPAAPAHAS
jgi:AhpD family alkylhydroperoxidase